MEEKKKSFLINPGTGMIDVIGHSGYDFNYAIADLIDNCISAKAKNIDIYFDLDEKNPYIYIKDDGNGMSIDKLKEAAVIGFKGIDEERNDYDLGRYSTGLKSATRSFCNKIYVCSKEKNKQCNTIQIDYEHIVKNKKWEAFEIEEFAFSKELDKQGTLIMCTSLLFSIDNFKENMHTKIDELENSLSHIFGKFLLSNKFKISIQVKGSKKFYVEGWNPFSLLENTSTKTVYNQEKEFHNSPISIKAYILPVYSNLSSRDQKYMEGKGLIDQQGFYVYRNNRLIYEGNWLSLPNISLDDKSKYARIEINISSKLDKEFNINFSKNSLTVPDELKPLFIEVAKKARKESRSNYDYIKHPEIVRRRNKDEIRIWQTKKSKDGMVLSINMEHPVILELSKHVPVGDLKKLLSTLEKSLPVLTLQSQEYTTASYTENEMKDMIDAVYKKYVAEGIATQEIKKKMASMEPFKQYTQFLIDYFDGIEDAKK